MATNCYEQNFPIAVCVDGPVGNGATAELKVQTTAGSSLIPGYSATVLGTVPGWNGAATVLTGWAVASWSTFTVTSASLTCTLVADNMVQVDVSISLAGDGNGGDIYGDCGQGPHTFTDSKVVPLTIGGSCPAV